MTSTPLRLLARDESDLTIISACLQDAILPVADMKFQPEEGRFVMLLNRFRWEKACREQEPKARPCERVLSALRIEGVTGCASRNLDRDDPTQLLELLALTAEPGAVLIHFAGDRQIRLATAGLACALDDLCDSWKAKAEPQHPAA